MGSWRNRLALESYTFKVAGSSPALPTKHPNKVENPRSIGVIENVAYQCKFLSEFGFTNLTHLNVHMQALWKRM